MPTLANYKGLQVVSPDPTGAGGLAIQNDLKKLVDWQAAVLDKDLNTPPGSPSNGDRYIVGPSPIGAWSTHANELAEWSDDASAWLFLAPQIGWPVYVTDEQILYFWNSTAWTKLVSGPAGSNTQVQFNDGGNLAGNASLTYDKTATALQVDNLKLDGNTLSATNTNGSLILSPNGNGAIQVDTGGNTRGESAVDLQSLRDDAAQVASGNRSAVLGSYNTASGYCATAVGYLSSASGYFSFAQGFATSAIGESSHAEGNGSTASGGYSHAEGYQAVASGWGAHGEGTSTASGNYSHAEGYETLAGGVFCHAEGYSTFAAGNCDHAEGYYTTASGYASHAEGADSAASGYCSHVEGYFTSATYNAAHAEGWYTSASGNYGSHAEGSYTSASGTASHAEGAYAVADKYAQHAHSAGQFNSPGDAQVSQFVVRNSTDSSTPTELYLDGYSIRLTIPTNTAWDCMIRIVAAQEGLTNIMRFDRTCLIVNNGGTTSLVGTVDTIGSDKGSAGWSVNITADSTHHALKISVTGAASTNISWVASVVAVEVAA